MLRTRDWSIVPCGKVKMSWFILEYSESAPAPVPRHTIGYCLLTFWSTLHGYGTRYGTPWGGSSIGLRPPLDIPLLVSVCAMQTSPILRALGMELSVLIQRHRPPRMGTTEDMTTMSAVVPSFEQRESLLARKAVADQRVRVQLPVIARGRSGK